MIENKKNSSNNQKELKDKDSFDYDITKTNSATDCTGLMPIPPLSEDELESYLDIYDMYPKVSPDETHNDKSIND